MILPVYDPKTRCFYLEMNGDPNVRERISHHAFLALKKAVEKATYSAILNEMYQPEGIFRKQTDKDYEETRRGCAIGPTP